MAMLWASILVQVSGPENLENSLKTPKASWFLDHLRPFSLFFFDFRWLLALSRPDVSRFIGYMVAHELSSYIVLKFRRLYDSFELAVYKETSLTVNANGFHRGAPQGFQPLGFAHLEQEQMHTICQMPFANDLFLLTILSIWTLSCVVEPREQRER